MTAYDVTPSAPTGAAEPVRRPDASGSHGSGERQAVLCCPYCAEETLFPLEVGWECRSCARAFSVTFLGLASRSHSRTPGTPASSWERR